MRRKNLDIALQSPMAYGPPACAVQWSPPLGKKSLSLIMLMLFLPPAHVGQSFGITRSWRNAGPGSDWATPSNWSPAGEPISINDVTIQDFGLANITTPGRVARQLRVGDDGVGELMIHPGGSLSSDSGIIGYELGSAGTVNVSGIWNSNEIIVGRLGTGAVRVDAGGQVASGQVTIGEAGHGEVTISGAGSSWTGEFWVKNGTLTIDEGGSASGVLLSPSPGDTAQVIVTGADSELTNAQGLNVWGGNLRIQNDATVYVGGTLELDFFPGSSPGSINLDGGKLRFNGYTRDPASTFNYTSGTIQLAGNRTVGTDPAIADLFGASPNIGGGKSLIVEGTADVLYGLNVNGGTFTSGALHIGVGSGTSTLTVNGGGSVFSTAGRIGDVSGSTGAMTVDGASSIWEAEDLYIGDSGSGTLSIRNGGTVMSDGFESTIGRNSVANGAVTVEGGSSLWDNSGSTLYVGRGGSGSLFIKDGGTVLSSGFINYIGYDAGSTGVVTVQGTDSTWRYDGSVFSLDIGRSGSGTLSIKEGGTVWNSGGASFIGRNSGATGVVTVQGHDLKGHASTWITWSLRVGGSGSGELLISDGGIVSNKDVQVGFAGGSGIVTVEGENSRWLIGDSTYFSGLEIGGSPGGTGTVNIRSGGNVTASGITRIFSNGLLKLDGGTLETAALDNRGLIELGGTLTATGGMTMTASGVLQGSGTVAGNITSSGRVAPGHSPGIMTINGNYTQSTGGVLEIEVASFTGSMMTWVPGTDHDQLQVTGTATLGGRLEIPVIDPLKSAGGPATDLPPIDFLTAGSVVGEFDAIVSPGLELINPGLTVDVEYVTTGPNQGARLRFVPTKLNLEFEDVDNDGTPSWQELLSWRDVTNPQNPVPAMETPTIAHDLGIVNNDTNAKTLIVDTPIERVARLTVGGGIQDLTLVVGDANSTDGAELLSSLTSATVFANGTIALNGGTLATSEVKLEGGTIRGNGLIDLSNDGSAGYGKLTVLSGTISPGFSAGHLDVDGDYRQGAGGVFELDVEGAASGQFDTVSISGDAQLGGTLVIDASQLETIAPGTRIEFLTVTGGIGGTAFDSVQTVGTDDIYFLLEYDEGGAAAVAGDKGDMNPLVPGLDPTDITAFALALRNPSKYFGMYDRAGSAAGDLDGWGTENWRFNGRLDFNDIDDFARLMASNGMGSASSVMAAIAVQLRVPEPSSAMLAIVGLGITPLLRGRKCSTNRRLETWSRMEKGRTQQ